MPYSISHFLCHDISRNVFSRHLSPVTSFSTTPSQVNRWPTWNKGSIIPFFSFFLFFVLYMKPFIYLFGFKGQTTKSVLSCRFAQFVRITIENGTNIPHARIFLLIHHCTLPPQKIFIIWNSNAIKTKLFHNTLQLHAITRNLVQKRHTKVPVTSHLTGYFKTFKSKKCPLKMRFFLFCFSFFYKTFQPSYPKIPTNNNHASHSWWMKANICLFMLLLLFIVVFFAFFF